MPSATRRRLATRSCGTPVRHPWRADRQHRPALGLTLEDDAAAIVDLGASPDPVARAREAVAEREEPPGRVWRCAEPAPKILETPRTGVSGEAAQDAFHGASPARGTQVSRTAGPQ
ncbi:hypothetical protein QJS66_06215 [Kocuria rhizophila]|nr:hypothetical protein QJS66_06215 [Kocuria rhizophila]